MEHFIAITWPDVQVLLDEPGFEENSSLINDDVGLDTYGNSAYYVNVEWLDQIGKNPRDTPQDGDEVNLSIPFTYEIGEANPITGETLRTVEDCIQAVRDELRHGFDWVNCNIEVV